MGRKAKIENDTATRERLLWCGIRSFAECGYSATNLRAVTRTAHANLCSIKYYFGSKAAFYQECCRHLFRSRPSPIDTLDFKSIRTESQWETALHQVIDSLTQQVFDQHQLVHWHKALMNRELVSPTAALDVMFNEFILPRMVRLEALLKLGVPRGTSRRTLQLRTFSIIGQLMTYTMARPIAARLFGQQFGSPAFIKAVAHYTFDSQIRSMSFHPPARKHP